MTNQRIENVIGKLERGISKSLQIFNSLPPEAWATPISDDPNAWSLRDLLAHFIYSEENMLLMAQDIASGGKGAPKDFNLDVFNEQQMRSMEIRDIPQLLSRLESVRATTLEWVRGLQESSLDLEGWHPVLGMTNLEGVLTAIYAHQLLHMREVLPRLKGN